MRYRCSLLSLAVLPVLFAMPAAAQQDGIRGSVKDMAGKAVPYANIVANDTASVKSANLAYVMSGADGNFSLPELKKDVTHLRLNVTAVGYAPATKMVRLDTVRHLAIVMEESAIKIAEIKVKVRAYTDTLAIDTEQMNLSNSSTLRDILNKTDGVIVSEDGGISFQGKQINKVLINGKEVFINQNKIALDNLNHGIMEKVQIINNHKDRFTLDFNNIRDPVINIDTKPEFKGVLKGELESGYGLNNKFAANGKGFYFSDKANVFATSHTNEVGQKELSERDVLASTTRHASATMRGTLAPFFRTDYQTRRNFASNSSLTARTEGENSKSGLVLYHGNIRTEKRRGERMFIADTLISAAGQTDEENGDFLAATAEYNRLLPGAVLKNTWSAVLVQRKTADQSTDTLFAPSPAFFGVGTRERPRSFALTDALRYTKVLGDRTTLNLGGEYYYERDVRDFETRLPARPMADIVQAGRFSKQQLEATGSLRQRFGKAIARAGLGIKHSGETGILENKAPSSGGYRLSRNVLTAEIPLRLEGTVGKLSYDVAAVPVFMHVARVGGRGLFSTSNTFVYDFDVHENIHLEADSRHGFYILNALFDTVVRSHNRRLANSPDLVHRQHRRDEVSVGWYKLNGKRGLHLQLDYAFRQERDFMQSVLDSISDGVFHYSNRAFGKKRTHHASGGIDKTLYIGSTYHRLSIGGHLDYTASRYPTLLNGRPARAAMDVWNPTIDLAFLPRNFFVRELEHRVGWEEFVFLMDGERSARQTVLTNRLSMRGHGRKTDWRISFEHYRYEVSDGGRFGHPDCSLSFKYELSEKVFLSASGRSLLTLFEWNDYSFVNTRFDGNTLNRTATDNNLGYLLFGVSLKI